MGAKKFFFNGQLVFSDANFFNIKKFIFIRFVTFERLFELIFIKKFAFKLTNEHK